MNLAENPQQFNPSAETACVSSNLAWALAIAAQGFPVFPVYEMAGGACSCGAAVCSAGKHPRTGSGHSAATTDADRIRAWWSTWPHANVAIAVPDGCLVVDVDPRNGGLEQIGPYLDRLPPDTRSVQTGGGGFHWYYRVPPGLTFPKKLEGQAGIDLKGSGGYVLAPPSNHASGGYYSGVFNEAIADAPAWLIALGRPRGEPRAPSARNRSGAETDGHDHAAVIALLEPHYTDGHKHGIAYGLGGYYANRGYTLADVERVASELPSADPDARMTDASDAFEATTPAGYSALREHLPAAVLADLERLIPDLTPEGRRHALVREPWFIAWCDSLGQRPASNDTRPAFEPSGSGDRTGFDPAVDYVIQHLATPSVGVFQRGGKLAIVTREACDDGEVIRPVGTPTIRELVPARLKEIIRTTAGHREANLASEVLARGEWSHVRPLDAIVSFPVMRRDGSLLLSSGYDAATRTLAQMTISVRVSDAPTQADARAALESLTALVGDFPFASDAQRSSWLAMLLTVLARPAIDGPTPLGLFEATQRGSGKSLLADVIANIVTGADAPRRVAPKTREEWDKVLFSILLAGDALVLFDNVTNMLASDALDAVLTGTRYAQRLLGVSEDRSVAIRTVFLASANNARLSSDLVRRSLGCRLEPTEEQPETRTGFKVPDLLGHVRQERAHYLSAALTVLRAYAVAGRPRVETRPMGSYTAWCRVVRDALVWAGASDPAETQTALRESADVERDELRDLLTEWHALLGDRAVTVRELIEAATGRKPGAHLVAPSAAEAGAALCDALRGLMPHGAEPAAHAVGNKLRTLRGQMVGGLVLKEGKQARSGRASYQVGRR